jgi:hypothetical protein
MAACYDLGEDIGIFWTFVKILASDIGIDYEVLRQEISDTLRDNSSRVKKEAYK